jgi:hypothetical protein
MGKRRDDEEFCPLYTAVARSRKTHESLKNRLRNTPRFNCTKITDAYWAACPVRSSEDDTPTLPGPGVTLLPPAVDRPYSGTAYTKIWVESAAPRFICYTNGRVFPWEWGFNPSRWGAFVEWLPLDGQFERDMLQVRIEKMGMDTTGTTQYLDYTQQGAWMLEYYMAMYFSKQYFVFPYVICTIVLDEQGKPLPHSEGGWCRMVGVDSTIADEIGASEEAMMGAAEELYPPLYLAINRVRLRVSEFL